MSMTTAEQLRSDAKYVPPGPFQKALLDVAAELDSLQKQLAEAVNHANKYERDYMDAVAKLAEAKTLLKKCEWNVVNPSRGIGYCWFCNGQEPTHTADCPLAAMVKED